MMSSTRWAGSAFMFLGACFFYALGCGSSSSQGGANDGGTSSSTTTATGTTGTLVTGTGTGVTGATTTAATGAGGAGGSTTTTTGTGTGGSGGSAGGNPGTSKLGATCKADADCGGSGLTCIKTSDNISAVDPGGPGNGICSMDCTMTPAACGPLGGICVAVDVSATDMVTRALCFEGCNVGPNPPAAPAAKCHSREDVVCEPVNQAETLFACYPLCVTDLDCGGGRKCEAASGLCVDAPKAGKALGAGCTVTRGMPNTECAGGLCLPVTAIPDGGTTAPGICTALCRLGTQEACGFRITPLDAGAPVGACVFPWGDTGYNSGDLGLCLQLCDTAGDCGYKASNWTCRTDLMVTGTGHSVCLVPPEG